MSALPRPFLCYALGPDLFLRAFGTHPLFARGDSARTQSMFRRFFFFQNRSTVSAHRHMGFTFSPQAGQSLVRTGTYAHSRSTPKAIAARLCKSEISRKECPRATS